MPITRARLRDASDRPRRAAATTTLFVVVAAILVVSAACAPWALRTEASTARSRAYILSSLASGATAARAAVALTPAEELAAAARATDGAVTEAVTAAGSAPVKLTTCTPKKASKQWPPSCSTNFPPLVDPQPRPATCCRPTRCRRPGRKLISGATPVNVDPAIAAAAATSGPLPTIVIGIVCPTPTSLPSLTPPAETSGGLPHAMSGNVWSYTVTVTNRIVSVITM